MNNGTLSGGADMVGVRHALKTIIDNSTVMQNETIPFLSAFGRTLAEDVFADIDIPPFNKSAMDGYAIRSSDWMEGMTDFTVTGVCAAGTFPETGVGRGECMKIMTGAPVPGGADSVVMIEKTKTLSDGHIRITGPAAAGLNICMRGEDIERGERVLRSGSVITAPEIAVLASVGKTEIAVVKRPSVAMLSTGSEIVEPEQKPSHGAIRNSNGPMLISLAAALGCCVEYLGIGCDDADVLHALVARGLEKDVFLVSGGVSMGDYDLVPEILKEEGAVIFFHKVRVKPGKPLLFARKGTCHIFGIPGNPVSNFTTFHMFIKPALLKIMGREDHTPRFLHASLEKDVHRKGSRTYIMPARCRVQEGVLMVQPLKLNGSADIVGCSGCNALLLVESSRDTVRHGETVEVMLLW